MARKYVIGIEYGAESGHAVLAGVVGGNILAVHETRFPHGTISCSLPSGVALKPGSALRHPDDYLHVLRHSVPEVLKQSGVRPEDVIGIGIALASGTVLPVDAKGIPLCTKPRFIERPHSWIKTRSHDAAELEARQIREMAQKTDSPLYRKYGSTMNAEWLLPKVWETLNEDPELFEKTDRFLEASDWLVQHLTGQTVRSSCAAAFTGMWSKDKGPPEQSFLGLLDSRLELLYEKQLRGAICPPGAKAGGLTAAMAAQLGLPAGTAVAVGCTPAAATLPGAGAAVAGKLVVTTDGSLRWLLLADQEKQVEGISGVAEGGAVTGLFMYEADQSSPEPGFEWFVEHGVPLYMHRLAEEEGGDIRGWMDKRTAAYKPGECGMLSFDRWRGGGPPTSDADAVGFVLGFTLMTKPEDIYRSMLESAAFEARSMIDTFETSGLAVNDVVMCGGLPYRCGLLMQIYADVLGKEIKLPRTRHVAALGAAMYGAVAAGPFAGGYTAIGEASYAMAGFKEETYKPALKNRVVYEQLYREYRRLEQYFVGDGKMTLNKLSQLKIRANKK